jgi:two-component system cell cycle sensor histidine kinase/response regulator CckA
MTRSLRVLHLEGTAPDAELVRHRLEVGGLACSIRVVTGKDGFEAALAGEPFDLIISDCNLPGYDGVAVLKHVLATQPDVPVILISGTVVEEQAVKCLQIGATDYLLKERLEHLAPAVERAVQDAEVRRAQKRVEVALGESEARKAAILESVLDCIVTMDANGNVVEFNAAAVRTFGYTKAEAFGRPLADLIIPPIFRDQFRAGLARYLTTGEGPLIGKLVEIGAVRKDGIEVPVEVAFTAIGSGATSIFTGVMRDITGRKNADAALSAERDRAQRYLDTAEIILLSLDLEGRITLVNRYACSLLGWSADELVGRSFIDTCIPARIRDDTMKRFRNVLAGPDSSIVENAIVTRSGEERLIEWRNTLLRDDHGRVVGTLSSGSDLTDRSYAEMALQETTTHLTERTKALEQHATALKESEERTNYALGVAGMGVWELDLVTRRLTWSKTMGTMYGLTPEQSPTTADGFLALIHPDDRRTIEQTLAATVLKGTGFEVQFRVLWPDGTTHWNAVKARVILDVHGATTRVLGVSSDISDRKLLETQFRQAQKMEAIGQLAGGVAHDFNNLLTAILGYSTFVIDTLAPQDVRRCDMEEVIKAGQRAAGLTKQLLAFSRKQVLEPTSVNINTLVSGIRPMLSRLIGEHVDLVSILEAELCAVRADQGQLEQVIMNLIVNARDAMPSGGRITVETANVELDGSFSLDVAVHPGRYAMLAVSDDGVGMDEETKRRLFEPFFTTKKPGKGTGLGLATVYGIVKQSGGYIWVFSEPGQGATFKLYLPCAEPDDTMEKAIVTIEAVPAATETVLIVEDEDAVRLLTRRILEQAGYRVFDAPNPHQAELLFERHQNLFKLVVTDVVMPGSSGPQMFDRMLLLRPDLKVLYVSGYTDDTIVHQGILNPGIALLQKPFTADALNRRVREVLDR